MISSIDLFNIIKPLNAGVNSGAMLPFHKSWRVLDDLRGLDNKARIVTHNRFVPFNMMQTSDGLGEFIHE